MSSYLDKSRMLWSPQMRRWSRQADRYGKPIKFMAPGGKPNNYSSPPPRPSLQFQFASNSMYAPSVV